MGESVINDSNKKENKIVITLLAISVFFLPMLQIVPIICWGVLGLFSILKGDFRNFWSRLFNSPFYLALIGLYLFYFVGMLWTEHYDLGWEDLTIKLPLLFFPFLFLTLPITLHSYKLIRKSLIGGCLTAGLICFGKAFQHYSLNKDLQDFYYTTFSILLHPTYFTQYVSLAVLFMLQILFEKENRKPLYYVGNCLLFFTLVILVIILNARIAMLTTFVAMILYSIMENKKHGTFLKSLPKMVGGGVVILFLFFSLIKVYNRFTQISDVIEKHPDVTALVDTVNHVGYNSTTIRIGLLKNGLDIWKNNFWFGVGTGDVIPETVANLHKHGLNVLAEKGKGAHNQYLQTAVTLGVFAFLFLFFSLIIPGVRFFKLQEYLFLSFIVIVAINAIGDTILRASALYFFTFFGCYFYKLSYLFPNKTS